MPSFSFIHTADLHLDSPFSALHIDEPNLAARLRSATFEAYDNIITLCLEKEVDFLLIAGDVYDGADRSLRAQIRFRDGLRRLDESGIQSFVVHGNHDPMESWASNLEWPKGVHIFGDRLETVEVRKEGALLACIQGISYPKRDERRNLSTFFKRKNPAFHIGLLHANVGTGTGHEPYAPCTHEDLIKRGMDYWALGHVHQKRILSHDLPFILYPGNTQGRNIIETGERGCYLVRAGEERGMEVEFHATDVIRWIRRDLPIKDFRAEQDLLSALDQVCLDISGTSEGRTSMARIGLTGPGPLYPLLQKPGTVPDLLEVYREFGMSLTPSVWIENILCRVKPESDLTAWAKGNDFVGELLRTSMELSEGDQIEEVLGNELASLYQNPRARRCLDMPDRKKMQDLLKRAAELCAEGLRGETDS